MSVIFKNSLPAQRQLLIISSVVAVTLLLALGSTIAFKAVSDPRVIFLYPLKNSKWIRFRQPTELLPRKPQARITTFRIRFSVSKVPEKAILTFKALKVAGVFLDHKLIFTTPMDYRMWKKVHRVNLSAFLAQGTHEIYINVKNNNGHPALLAYCSPLNLYTGEHWEASRDFGKSWSSALRVDDLKPAPLSRQFRRTDHALISKAPIFLPLFITLLLVSLFYRRRNHWPGQFITKPENIRWLLMLLLVLLGSNNIWKIPWYIGMDAVGHLDYIHYVAKNWRIPFATEGWKMFESPLYYFLSAILFKSFTLFLTVGKAFRLLRIVPLICGVLQVELCYRAVRHVHPEQKHLQTIGTIVGGLLPMNIYMAQVVGSEPLAGLLSGLVILLVLRSHEPHSSPARESLLLIAFFLGLSILTKITAILLVPPVVLFLILKGWQERETPARSIAVIIRQLGLVFIVIVFVCGWYYLRNRIEMGRFFVGGWDHSRALYRWQDPGYRTLRQFAVFGESMLYPLFSGLFGLWDSLYSTMWADGFLSGMADFSDAPPWNYDFMLSSIWLSILPSATIFLGFFGIVKYPQRSLENGSLFAALCILIYLTAMVYIFLIVPFYSIGKATYMLGLTPCFAVLCAGGFDILMRNRLVKAILLGILGCWALNVFLTYWVVR